MIIRPSLKLAARLKCPVTRTAAPIPQTPDLNSWSGDLFTMRGLGSHAVMMNDATLSPVIIPLTGIRNFEQFLSVFLQRIANLWRESGASFDPSNQSVLVLKRTNRSLIGTMNDTMGMIAWFAEDDLLKLGSVPWDDVEDGINDTPFSVLKYSTPRKTLEQSLAGSR